MVNADAAEPYVRIPVVQEWSIEECIFDFTHLTLPQWSQIEDVEISIIGHWDHSINRLASQNGNALTLQPPNAFFHNANISPITEIKKNAKKIPKYGKRWSHFENAPEMLDQAGEWYLNRKTGTLRYWPLPGEDMQTLAVIAPYVQPSVIVIQGDADKPVKNLHFANLTIAHAGFTLPAQGFNPVQAGAYFDDPRSDAIQHVLNGEQRQQTWPVTQDNPVIHIASRVQSLTLPGSFTANGWQQGSITGCRFAHSASYGVAILSLCRDIVIEGTQFTGLGAGGIRTGENWRVHYVGKNGKQIPQARRDELLAKAPSNISISNNVIHACGRHFRGSIGIWAMYTNGLNIEHNELFDLPYSAISCGWDWKEAARDRYA